MDIPLAFCFAQGFLLDLKKLVSVWKEDLHLQIDLWADLTNSTLPFANPLEPSGSCLAPKFLYKYMPLGPQFGHDFKVKINAK